ncbi:hypothetical protein L3054_10860 [Corynebacterium sp. MC-10]|nr:hypothetical protein [Corynebacterium parakroppenstedtii]
MLFPANTYGLCDLNYGREIMIDQVMQPTKLPECDTRPSSEQVMEHGSNEITKEMHRMPICKIRQTTFSNSIIYTMSAFDSVHMDIFIMSLHRWEQVVNNIGVFARAKV